MYVRFLFCQKSAHQTLESSPLLLLSKIVLHEHKPQDCNDWPGNWVATKGVRVHSTDNLDKGMDRVPGGVERDSERFPHTIQNL